MRTRERLPIIFPMRPPIVFAHANGFPAGTYRVLFEAWRAAGWRVLALPMFGHDPKRPPKSNWPHQRDELIDFIEHEGAAPAYLVGHSMGGYLSLLAASKRPGLARGIVLLDSPVVGGLLAHGVRVFKATGWGKRFSPGRISTKRREHWPGADLGDVHAHFAAKPAFARWAPGVLDDYVASGTRPDAAGTGRVLAFERDIETALYETLPHHLVPLLRRHPVGCPVAFIGGRQSTEVRQVGMVATRRITRGRIQWIDGSHLFPFERPHATAACVLARLKAFEAAASASDG